jgi:predicted aconitase with swiveling domain
MLKSHFPYAATAVVLATLLAGNGALFVITVAAVLAFIPMVYAEDDETVERYSRDDR